MHGRRALRARTLNLAAVAASVAMNALAAAPGWRNLTIWVLPPAAYALASDTLITVIRTRALTHHQLTPDQATPLNALGCLILWLLRLALAPASTLTGFRAWVLEQCPVAPALRPVPSPHPAQVSPWSPCMPPPRSPRPWPLSRTCTPVPPAPPCAKPSWPPRPETSDDDQVRHRADHRPDPGRHLHLGVPARPDR